MKHSKLKFNIGIALMILILIPLLLVLLPLIGIASGIWRMITGKSFAWLYNNPILWACDLPFKISQFDKYN